MINDNKKADDKTSDNKTKERLEIVCPAGTPAALEVAVNSGADAVYTGFRNETNARNFPGLNFSPKELATSVEFAHANGSKVFVAINTFPKADNQELWHQSIDDAVAANVDAIILADIGLLDYASNKHPDARLHLSVQASASNAEAINFFNKTFGVKRVVLPRVLTIPEIKKLNSEIDVETEIFAFGGLCVMAEGRCSLSSYITGESPNMNGVCSPASHVRYEKEGSKMVSKLNDFTINEFEKFETAGYPTLCKGRFSTDENDPTYLFEEPTSLNVIEMIPELVDAGVLALKIEGRQRSKAYVKEVVQNFRSAVDSFYDGNDIINDLGNLAEGQRGTSGAYVKKWQ